MDTSSHPPSAGSADSARLLAALLRNEPGADGDPVAVLHAELRELAARHMAGQRPGHTLQPTALVNELWVRVFGLREVEFKTRKQFYAFASRVMRSVLVDHARARRTEKRGGEREARRVSVSLAAEGSAGADPADAVDLVDLDAALERLRASDPELERVVELRFFGGLSSAAGAEMLGVSERTVERRWRLARAWLHVELER